MLREFYDRIATTPSSPSREFIIAGYTYGEVYRLAANICMLHKTSACDSEAICLCTTDKALIAAALLASLHGGPRIIIPYSFSRQALQDTRETMAFSKILSDSKEISCPDTEIITPVMLSGTSHLPEYRRHPDEPFVTLFTGGSTGKSKLWSKTPRNLFGEALYLCHEFGLTSDDIIISTVPPQHIYGLLFSVLLPFISSCKLLPELYTFPREILEAINKYNASILVSVPPHYRVLKIDNLQKCSLRMAFSSAGILNKNDADFFYLKTGIDITEIYGSTETGGVATRQRLVDGETWKSFDIVDWKIKNKRLHVRSDFLSPELPRDEAGFFMTADRVKPEGKKRFTLSGRIDDIVKVGGKRVDLVDVQKKIKQIPGVRDAVVFTIPARNGRENDIAAMVAGNITVSQLRLCLGEVNEPYAIPRHFSIVDSIPVTPTGKYDRTLIEQIFHKRQ